MKFFLSSKAPKTAGRSKHQKQAAKEQTNRRHKRVAVFGASLLVIAAFVAASGNAGDQKVAVPSQAATVTTTPKPPAQASAAVTTPKPLAFTHQNIITTEFWVGEPADGDNGNISNTMSTWDQQWQQHYGGFDNPNSRNGYLPVGFTPLENPFYFALPYSDLDSQGSRKAGANHCLQVSATKPTAYSYCKNIWIAIKYGDKTSYAQWEDAGPFGENDVSYVFGTAPPNNTTGDKAGLDVSPAVTTYLGLNGLNATSWTFVNSQDVPNGPWKQIITTTTGESAN